MRIILCGLLVAAITLTPYPTFGDEDPHSLLLKTQDGHGHYMRWPFNPEGVAIIPYAFIDEGRAVRFDGNTIAGSDNCRHMRPFTRILQQNSHISRHGLHAQARRMMRRWEQHARVRFVEVPLSRARLIIGELTHVRGVAWANMVITNTPRTYRIIQKAAICISPDALLVMNEADSNSRVSLERAFVHELGHILGLDHPTEGNDPSKLMGLSLKGLVRLSTMDQQAIQLLYGPPQ